ncbi:hydroxylysine kinase-like [Macrobrachium nipponense]|uniref:hydroxylysine kinase-like n=1 Tax=Macrobrachium nipponense TaxID=159736 RepID=UPI0030C88ECA
MAAAAQTNSEGVLKPGQLIRPIVNTSEVPALVSRLYGLTVTSVKELNSYDDKNFYIQVAGPSQNPHITDLWSHGYTLKILNSMDTKNEKLVDAQNQMMLFLHSKGFNVPKPQKNVFGLYMKAEKLTPPPPDDFLTNNMSEDQSQEYMVRLLTFLPGKILHQVEYTAELFYECGIYVGKIDKELKNFQNETLLSRKSIWKLESTPELRNFVFAVKDEGRHKMITEILEAWDMNVAPVIPKLEKGMIHGDLNEQNIIVQPDASDSEKYHISGLIDFGDIQFSCFVFEIAIAIMYMMIEVNVMEPNDAGGHVLAGYLTERDLTETEWGILKECVAARFAQSLTMGAYSIQQDPGNEYLVVTAAKGWNVLGDFWSIPKEQIISRWKSIIESYQRNG